MQKIEVRLSDAYEVIEQLKKRAHAYTVTSNSLAQAIYFDGTTPSVLERLSANSMLNAKLVRAIADAKMAESYMLAWAGACQAVSREHARLEHSTLIAEIAVTSRLLSLLKKVLAAASEMASENKYVKGLVGSNGAKHTVDAQEVSELRAKVAQLANRSVDLALQAKQHKALLVTLEVPSGFERDA